MKTLFVVTAVLEVLVGVTFIIAPAPAADLCFAATLQGVAAMNLARGLGAALLALGLALWWARNDGHSRAGCGLVAALLAFNAAVAVVLAWSAVAAHRAGISLWPFAAAHAGIAAWCVWSLRTRTALKQKTSLN